MTFKKRACWVILGLFLFSYTAWAGPRRVMCHLTTNARQEPIPGLSWVNPGDLPLVVEFGKYDLKHFALIKGRFNQPNAKLFFGSQRIEVHADNTFDIKILLKVGPSGFDSDLTTKFIIRSVSEQGKITAQNFSVSLVRKYKDRFDDQSQKFWVSASVGYTFISYQQTATPSFFETGITAKGNISYVHAPKSWFLGLSSYFTVLPVTTNIPENTARFLGVNARVGHALPWIRYPWEVSMVAGIYYVTMFTSGIFGFDNLMGPQVFPTVRYNLSRKDSISSYFKFSPVSTGLNLENLSNREFAFGFDWRHFLLNGNSISVSADLANLRFSAEGGDVNTSTATMSVGYGF